MTRKIVIVFFLILYSSVTYAEEAKYPGLHFNAYLDGKDSKIGIVLAHGRGQNPTWNVVEPLRKGIHEKLGYHTLSLQMPNSGSSLAAYAEHFPDSYKRIQAAIDFLRNEKKVENIYLIGHGMGTRMMTAYLAESLESGVSGFIGVGMKNDGDNPLNNFWNLQTITTTTLDIYGDGDGADVSQAEARAILVDERENYTQAVIEGADHKFSSGNEKLVKEVVSWLTEQNK